MKNTNTLQVTNICEYCKNNTMIQFTPNGGDQSCPLCGHHNYNNVNIEYNYDDDNMFNYGFCKNCHIIYETGCIHQTQGCTDSIYNGHLICEWKDKRTNVKFEGMPYFDDVNDWIKNVNNVEVIRQCCPNKIKICVKQTYQTILNCWIK